MAKPKTQPQPLDKGALLDAVLAKLTADVEQLAAQAAATREGATHEEARPENDKDTRSIEASYLARGQAQRVEDTAEAIARLKFMEVRTFKASDEISLSALVTLEGDDGAQVHFVVPTAGGLEVTVAGTVVRLVTPASPVGRELMGKCEGDDFFVTILGKKREYEILRVQ